MDSHGRQQSGAMPAGTAVRQKGGGSPGCPGAWGAWEGQGTLGTRQKPRALLGCTVGRKRRHSPPGRLRMGQRAQCRPPDPEPHPSPNAGSATQSRMSPARTSGLPSRTTAATFPARGPPRCPHGDAAHLVLSESWSFSSGCGQACQVRPGGVRTGSPVPPTLTSPPSPCTRRVPLGLLLGTTEVSLLHPGMASLQASLGNPQGAPLPDSCACGVAPQLSGSIVGAAHTVLRGGALLGPVWPPWGVLRMHGVQGSLHPSPSSPWTTSSTASGGRGSRSRERAHGF